MDAAGFHWQFYEIGEGPDVLFLHGTGSSSHSWRALVSQLSANCRLIMPDLPGHGGSTAPSRWRLTLDNMSKAVTDLMTAISAQPVFVIGHSAGAAILAHMALEGGLNPRVIVSLNGAFLPFQGAANPVFGSLARLLSATPLVPHLAARRLSNRRSVRRLISQVGSAPHEQQVDDYVALLQSPKHISAALGMMANWNLEALSQRLPGLNIPLHLVACERDRAVPAVQANMLAERLPNAQVHRVPGLGHLGHEENPAKVAKLLNEIARECDIEL